MGLYLNAPPTRAAQFNIVETVVWRNSSFSGKSSCAGRRQQQCGQEICGDRILVEPRAAYFYAFGAVNRPGEQLYDADTISLARMLARLEGLADSRADPAEVFIYRRQEAELTRAVARTATAPGQDLTRVIYRVNLRDPGGFFVSQAFPVLPDDLVYVSESPIAEVAKVFQVLTGVSAIGAIPHNLGVPY